MAQLVGHCAREVEIGLLVRRPPVGAHAELRKGGDLARQLLRRRARRPDGDDPVRQPHLQGLLRLHRAACEDQVERPRESDQARQADGAAVDQWNAPPPAEHPERRVLGDDPQVAPERQLQAPGHCVAFDGGDRRFVEQQPRGPHRPVAFRRHAVVLARGELLRIGPGAESPSFPPEHRHARFRVGLERPEGVRERSRRLRIHCVPRRRPAEDDRRDGPLLLDAHAHAPELSALPGRGKWRR